MLNNFFKFSYTHCVKAEQSILGSLILNNSSWYKVSDILIIDDFYFKNHRLIFSIILEFLVSNKSFDILVICEKIKEMNIKNFSKLSNYLNIIIQKTPNPSNIKNYVSVIHKMSILRKLLSSAGNIINNIYKSKNLNVSNLLNELDSEIFNINKYYIKDKSNISIISILFDNVLKKIEFLHSNPNCVSGIPTGFKDLDDILSGFHNGELVVIAGRPSIGKTTFSINIAQNIAINLGLPVIIYSMEMSSTQLVMRMISSICEIDQHNIRTGKLTNNQLTKIKNVISNFKSLKIFIDESVSLTTIDIYSKSKKIIREYGNLGLIVIDYLQLMTSTNSSLNNRVMEISEISRNLKCLARELNVPIIAISQLNRSLESRCNKRPIMSDLRESGAIEQDADVILFVYRDEVYNLDDSNHGTAEIIIAKQRNGPTGMVKLSFLGKNLKFENS